MTDLIFKQYPLQTEDYDSDTLDKYDVRKLNYLKTMERKALYERDKIIETQIKLTHSKLKKDFYIKNIKPLNEQLNEYRKEIHRVESNAIERNFEKRFRGNELLIFEDVKARVDEQLRDPIKLNEVVDLLQKTFKDIDKQFLFKEYAKSLHYEAARGHWNYCKSRNLVNCIKQIEDYIMEQAKQKFKDDYGFEAKCDFSLSRNSRHIAQLRKPHERMLDPLKVDDSIVNYDLGDIVLSFNKEKKLNVQGLKMLDFLLVQSNNSNYFKDDSFQIPIKNYMEICGLTSYRNAKKQIANGLMNLMNLKVTIKDDEKKSKINIYQEQLIRKFIIKNGYLFVRLDEPLIYMIRTSRYMTLPNQLFRINNVKFPNSYYLLKRVSEHKNINKNSTNEDILTIKTLLESCPNLPKYNEIKTSGQINQRIKDPFFRDLDHLAETFTYELFTANKVRITVERAKELPFEEFENIRIHIKWVTYPNLRKTKTELS